MKNVLFITLSVLVTSFDCFSANLVDYITTETPEGRVITATAVNDNIIRVTNRDKNEAAIGPKTTVKPAITAQSVSVSTTGGRYSILTTGTGVTVTLDQKTGQLTINGGSERIITDNGKRMTGADGKKSLQLRTISTSAMYGAGERGHKLDLRGDTLTMFNRQNYGYTEGDPRINQMNITMPLFISEDGFALLFDDYAAAEMILSNPIQYSTESPNSVAYYYINGAETMADVTENLSSLTGRQDLPPLWSLGYITSKYGYRTQQETLGVIDTLKRKGYPVDGIVLDLYWYGKEQDMGRLAWEPKQWPSPTKMLSTLSKEGVNMVIISQPYILRNGRGLSNYNYLSKNGLLVKDTKGNPLEVKIWVGEGGMFDVSNAETCEWLGDRYKQLTEMGVSGWWGDLGEPEVHPDSAYHANGLTMRQYHNQYGNDWSRIVYEMFHSNFPGRRLMTMMRGGTIGLQRYSVFPWSTDVSRSWGGLQPQIKIMLNSGLSGLGYMGHDVGGFAVDPENAYMPELYVRWLQLGTFSPILRTHAQQYAEPYLYPQYASIIEPLIKERYRWLPYNYTLAYENATKGYPLVRPLNFHQPSSRLANVTDEYLWGEQVLVAPILNEGQTSRDVLLPDGVWIDYNHPTKRYTSDIKGYAAPLSVLPMFVKAGAFIPTADYKMGNTGDYTPDKLTVNYYPVEGVKSVYSLFDDDRKSSRSLAEEKYRLTDFVGEMTQDGSHITINIASKGTYAGAPKTVDMTLVINGVTKAYNASVNGKAVSTTLTDGKLKLTFKYNPAKQCKVMLTR
jgi:alpha-glucosidase (family GH31 glycosyl hydrolase)